MTRMIISILVIVGFFVLAGTKILPIEVTLVIISGAVSSVLTYWFKEREIARLKK